MNPKGRAKDGGQLELIARRAAEELRVNAGAVLRERVVMALGCAERARRELAEANDHMRQIVATLGLSHPSVGKIASALHDAQQAVAQLSELRSRLPK